MPSTYTTNNGIELIATGEQSGTWGDTTNTNLELLDASLDGQVTVTLSAVGSSGSPNDLPVTNGAASNGRNRLVIFNDGGDLGGTAYVRLTPNDAEKIIFIRNALTASRSILVFQGTYSASNDYEIPNGTTGVLYFNGAGSGAVAANVFNNAVFDGVSVDTISEKTSGSGVTIDTVLLKDDVVNATDVETTRISANDGTTAINIANSTGAVDIDTSLNVDGTVTDDGATHDGDVTFTGASYDVVWDKSDNALEFGDNAKAIFGAGPDLQIYHDGSNSHIRDTGTGDLIMLAADSFRLQVTDTWEYMIKADKDASVQLYYDNALRLATTAAGVDVTGTVTMDGGSTSADFSFGDSDKALFGAGNDLQIYHDGSNSYILENGTGNLIAKGNAGIYLRGTNDEEMATFLQDGAVTLYHDNTARIATTSAGVTVTGATKSTTGFRSDDSVWTYFGSSNDAGIKFDGSSFVSRILVSGTNNFAWQDTGGSNRMLLDTDQGDLILYSYDTETDGPNLLLRHVTTSPADDDTLGRVIFQGENSADELLNYGYIIAQSHDVTDANEDATIFIQGLTAGQNKSYFIANSNGAKSVRLFYDGLEKFATTSSGIDVTGDVAIGNTTSASVDVGGDLSTGTAKLEIGTGRSGSGYSYIDLVGDTTYSDYGLRIIRSNTGANAPTSIEHRGTGSFTVKSTEAADILFQTTNAERMRIQAGGNVGIAAAAPAQKLEVGGVIRGTYTQGGLSSTFWSQNTGYFGVGTGGVASEGSYAIHITSNGYRNSSAQWTSIGANGQTGAAQIGLYPPGYIAFGTEATKSTGDTSVLVDEKMRLTAGGSLGIGTTAPGAQLHISNAVQAVMRLQDSGGSNHYGQMYHNSGSTYFQSRQGASHGRFHWTTYDGSTSATRMSLSAAGILTKANQPAFQAVPSATQSDIAIDGWVTVVLGTERFDVASNFASNAFTAPTAGKYMLCASLRLDNVDAAASYYVLLLNTSNKYYYNYFQIPGTGDVAYLTKEVSVVADMDASDTASMAVYQSGGTSQTDIITSTNFSGYLLG